MRNYLLLGRTGVGKSSFINTVFGEDVTEISDFEACTKVVHHYVYDTPLGNICFIDTLAEDEDRKTDEDYLSLIKENVDFQSLYAVLYVSRLDERR